MTTKTEHTQTKIATKYGKFNIRVYADSPNKETVVLWTENLDTKKPVLVRVHSECLTGDIFGSFQCDCGEQLQTALNTISKHGGVLIYLRQEGRGIGLFEKIKTYQLQSKGYDTFEANVLLGHLPDQRTYHMVKIALDDLNIANIILCTNNPSKVSEIAKLGINIVDRLPVYIKPNEHNRRYLETKKNKFQHRYQKEANHYFYQFHAETINQIKEVSEFIKDKKRDPLLRICVGINANLSTLDDSAALSRITSLFEVCSSEKLIAILHFSFTNTTDVLSTIDKIKEKFPSVYRLHMNDIDKLDTEHIEKAIKYFQLDIPLSDNNFEIIHDQKIQTLIKAHAIHILLDNSKGKGIKESKEAYKEKINFLLKYGLNDIALCGGFGPDKLSDYFDLRRYYRINFSIDAESNLKTDGKLDLIKTKDYLNQLLRFDDPKFKGIDQTKKILEQSRRTSWDKVSILGHEFLVSDKVFHPGVFESGTYFASKIMKYLQDHKNFCEIGCGSGIVSCILALSNPKVNFVATDINLHASENTKLNAEKLGIADQIEIFTGDVLDSIKRGYKFDFIFWALPFGFLDPGEQISFEEHQVFDPGYKSIRKFFETAKQFLNPEGRLLIGFSHDLGHSDLLIEIATKNSLKLKILDKFSIHETEHITFDLIEGRYQENKI